MIAHENCPNTDQNGVRPGPGIGSYFRCSRAVRAMLLRRNTCCGPNNWCGGKRRNRTMVVHFRSCGGVIAKPTVAEVQTVRTTRSMRRQQGIELQQLVFQYGRSTLRLRTAGTTRRQETSAERIERERRERREQGRDIGPDNKRRLRQER